MGTVWKSQRDKRLWPASRSWARNLWSVAGAIRSSWVRLFEVLQGSGALTALVHHEALPLLTDCARIVVVVVTVVVAVAVGVFVWDSAWPARCAHREGTRYAYVRRGVRPHGGFHSVDVAVANLLVLRMLWLLMHLLLSMLLLLLAVALLLWSPMWWPLRLSTSFVCFVASAWLSNCQMTRPPKSTPSHRPTKALYGNTQPADTHTHWQRLHGPLSPRSPCIAPGRCKVLASGHACCAHFPSRLARGRIPCMQCVGGTPDHSQEHHRVRSHPVVLQIGTPGPKRMQTEGRSFRMSGGAVCNNRLSKESVPWARQLGSTWVREQLPSTGGAQFPRTEQAEPHRQQLWRPRVPQLVAKLPQGRKAQKAAKVR